MRRTGLCGVEDELEAVAPMPVVARPRVGIGRAVEEPEESPDVGGAERVERACVGPVLSAEQEPLVHGAFGQ